MKRNIIGKIIVAVLLVGAIAGLGVFAYRAGMAQGLGLEPLQLQDGRFPMTPSVHYGHPMMSIGRVLGALFLTMLVFGAIRTLLWGGPRRWHRMHGRWGMPPMAAHGDWACSVPPVFEEWHRQAHAKETDKAAESAEAAENETE
ncbi:MAG: hypothetical protein K8R77_00130 [Anaerolineaceae bacterium]|nr:hypothetical protein [Anaerolineaceae bacterium]